MDSVSQSGNDADQANINIDIPLKNKFDILASERKPHHTHKKTKLQVPLIAGFDEFLLMGTTPPSTNHYSGKKPSTSFTEVIFNTRLSNGDTFIKGDEAIRKMLCTHNLVKLDNDTCF